MGIQHREGGGFALQRFKQREKQRMLQAISMIAGMKGVAVIHSKRLMGQGVAGCNGAAPSPTQIAGNLTGSGCSPLNVKG
jgi:hypothetical protein